MPPDPEREEALALLPSIRYGRVAMSKHALPFVTVARHLVDGESVLIRIHRGFDYHSALAGNVVAFEAGNVESGASEVWSVQFVGQARLIEPTEEQLERFGPLTERADGQRFDPAYLRIDPEFVTVHRLSGVPGPTGRSRHGPVGPHGPAQHSRSSGHSSGRASGQAPSSPSGQASGPPSGHAPGQASDKASGQSQNADRTAS
ncbi:pyridoxamine 5'-phosphate oxidase family protein [Streptomyces sp. NBC_01795]|uniref:pyridoxamine 5'-phosphate oxidase family protein n=1 Tax=unclassified Streptomyces TaxID=2593676 RepID=UPI002DDC11C3|nr:MULTISPECIES: pyridoxamine 5'-phosphate oxidase family protein [unclassified Streptomyces]WSA93567.1 pyridoxamine 5'-phosphate oxidase family protein [Streptomyces sp. NBC_01795]WSB77937.1 pyridoxamine 5'-phosphate oxidase family protein [Streptomyces sp. NBC_01775]